jgi:hypothetical protein
MDTGIDFNRPWKQIVRAAGTPDNADLDRARQHCSVAGNSSTESAKESSEDIESHKASTACNISGAQT